MAASHGRLAATMRLAVGLSGLLGCSATPTVVIPPATEALREALPLVASTSPRRQSATAAEPPPGATAPTSPAPAPPATPPGAALAARIEQFYASTGAFACDMDVHRVLKA